MILKQYYLGCLAHASYMIVSEAAKEAVVVDPQRDINQYINDSSDLGIEIKYVFLTHFHAGYRSSIACSILENQGYSNFADLIGGISAWESSKN